MKKRLNNIKKQAKNETKKIGMVILGFVGGTAVAKGLSMLAEKFPEHEDFINYSKAPLLGATGWLICNASDEDAVLAKHFGYGVVASGALEGLKIIPVAKDILSGVEENVKSYYTEDSPLQIGNFGLNHLPVKSIDLGEVAPIEVELPELDAKGNLGYYGDQTRDGDNIKGII